MASPIMAAAGWGFSKADIGSACKRFGPLLNGVPAGVDPVQLMWAIALNESIWHESHPDMLFCPPRFEPAYFFGGAYCDEHGSAEAQEQYKYCTTYSSDAAKSYGPWQVMYLHTHGAFKPEEFQDLDTGAQLFLMFMNHELRRQKPETLEEILDMYNSGNWRDRHKPEEYIARGVHHYLTNILG